MYLKMDEHTQNKIKESFSEGDKLIFTFEDGVGRYSQHAMIHMMVQFTVGIIPGDAKLDLYDSEMDSDLGVIYYKSESADYLDENMSLRFKPATSSYVLASDGGIIDENIQFIDFKTHPELIKK